MTWKIVLPMLVLAAFAPVSADDRVSIRVSPSVAFAPANLVVRATVPLREENRSLEIIAESPSFYRSSEITLDGNHAPRVTTLQLQSLPGGEYEVRAVLRGTAGRELAEAEVHVNIVDPTVGH